MKGQSSVEFISIVSIAIILASPFILQAQSSLIETSESSDNARFQASLDEFVEKAERVDTMGGAASDSLRISVPGNVVDAKVVGNDSIVYTVEAPEGRTNYTRLIDANIRAGTLPTSEGARKVSIEALEDGIEIKSEVFDADFEATEPLIVNQNTTFKDRSDIGGNTISQYRWYINSSLEASGPDKTSFEYNFTEAKTYNITLNIESIEGEQSEKSRFYKPDEQGVITEAFSLETQTDWNQGFFNRTSADRNDNSGNLGLGYLNGTNPSSTNLEEGLVGYWRLDKSVSGSGGTVEDYSGENNDGATNGGVSTGVGGILGSESMSFGSGEYVEVPSDSSLEGMENLAISAWVKPNSLGKDYIILGGQNLYEIVLDDGNNRCSSGQNLWWAVENGDGDWTINCEDITIPTNSWTHVALVSDFSSNEIRIYKNGQLEVTNSGTGTVSSNGNPLGIGQRPDGFGSFDGKIDEARVYNHSLSESEIKKLYLEGKPFKGNYTSKTIENSDAQNWKELEIQASINSTTDELTATFETLKDSLLFSGEQAYNSVNDWNQGDFNKTTSDEVVEKQNVSALQVLTQEGFNQGQFDGTTSYTEYVGVSLLNLSAQKEFNQGQFTRTSADRKDNSGDLGLGYLNDTSNLEAYYRFDRDVNPSGGILKDYSGNGNDLTYTGTSTPGSEGVFSTNSTDWDGSSAANSSNVDFNINETNEASVALWIYGDPSVQPQQNTNFRALDSSDNRQLNTHIPWDNGNVYWDTAGDYNRIYTSVDSSKWEGKWNFWVFRHDSSTGDMDMYVNNQLVTSSSSQTATYENIQELSIGAAPGVGTPYDGRMDELMIFNDYISMQTMEELYIHGGDGVFEGNYTAEKIDNSQETNWDSLEINASIPSDTSVNATFKALDTNGNLVDSQSIDLNEGLRNYSLSVSNSEDAEVLINGTSSNATKSWEIHGLEVFSEEVDSEGLRTGYQNGSQGDNLVGYWRLDSDSAEDYSGEGNNGSLNGGISTNSQGILNSNSYRFDGTDDYGVVPNDGSFEIGGSDFTTSAWVNYGSIKSSHQTIVSHRHDYLGSGYPGYDFLITKDTGKIRVVVEDSSNIEVYDSNTEIPRDQWVLLTAVFDRDGNVQFYLNGSKDGSGDISAANGDISNGRDLRIGAQEDDTGSMTDYFDGNIDEIKIYNKSLTQEEVKNLYFNGRPFKGNYTAKKIDNSQETEWNNLEVNATIPVETSVNATFKALDSAGNLVDSQSIDLNEGLNNYSLSVSNSEDAEVFINGTSSNVTKSWEVHGLEVFSSEIEVKDKGLRIGYKNGSSGDDLVGYWRMDRNVSSDGGTLEDYSGEGYDGKTKNGVATGSSGTWSSNATKFDGTNYIDVGAKNELSMANGTDDYPFSISAWIKVPSSDVRVPILTKMTGSPGNWEYGFWTRESGSGGDLVFRLYSGGGADTLYKTVEFSDPSLFGEWVHVAGTYNGNQTLEGINVYINGEKGTVAETQNSNYDGVITDSSNVDIGVMARDSSYSSYAEGSIDELRMYNRSLSDQEIKDLYFNGRPFQGNYTAEKIDNSQETDWEKVEVNASVPLDTSLTAEFEALDSDGNAVDEEFVSVGDGVANYSLGVNSSEDARLSFNGTSSNVTETWKVYDYKVYSGEREVDESELFSVQDGLNEFFLGISDSKDARIRLNGTSSDVRESWGVESLSVFVE